MSEFTRYFVIKNQTKGEVQKILEEQKIYSLVAAKRRKNAKGEKPTWVVVAAPESLPSKNGDAFPTDVWKKLTSYFETVVALSVDEDGKTAELEVAHQEQKPFSLSFGRGKIDVTTLTRATEIFNKPLEKLASASQSGIRKFCALVGIPYFELLDQNISPDDFPKNNQHTYSLTDDEMEEIRRLDAIPDEADQATWVEISPYPEYGKDKYHVYFQGKMMPLADPYTFRVEKAYGIDKKHVFYKDEVMPEVDVATFTTDLPMHFSKDKNHIYYCAQVLPDVDMTTFEVFSDSAYARDKNHIYYMNEILEDADRETFKIKSWYEAKDKHGKFTYGLR